MASLLQFLLLSFSFTYFTSISHAMLVLPLTKDASTFQYKAKIFHGTPLLPINLVVDLSGPFLWLDSASASLSSSHRPIHCSKSKSHGCGCTTCFPNSLSTHINHTCGLLLENPITRTTSGGNLVEDTIAVRSEDGSIAADNHNFLFYCVPAFLSTGLASGTKGILGLGRTRFGLPSQLAMAYGLGRKFAFCLSSTHGVIFIGDGPYISVAGADNISKSLLYTPVITNQGDASSDYIINVKSIKINGKRLSLSRELGGGGAKISTVVPYTTMESSIYETFIRAYIKVATNSMNMTRVASVGPFGVCFSSEGVERTRVGAAVPIIDLVLQSEMVKWRIYGRNSMVRVSEEVMCLGFLDGGLNPTSLIVIGGFQLEDNLVEFDMGTSMLGFSSSLLLRQTTCSNLESYSINKESS